MADRYWVGGGGTWNTTSTTNWGTAAPLVFTASSSGGTLTTTGSPALVVGMNVYNATGNSLGTITGGSGNTWTVSQNDVNASQTMTAAFTGASVPTVSDNVIFSQPATYTVTMTGALACLDITVSAGTVTFATGTAPTLNVRGSMTLLAGTVWSSTGAITFSSTATGRTVTTNGTTLSGSVTFNGVGGGWTLGSALTTSGTLGVTEGTFDTSALGNYALTCVNFSTAGSAARTINFNASTITISVNSSTAFNGGLITGITFNAGTSQINLTGATSGISSPNLSFYNVAFTGTTAAPKTITGVNTFNNFAVTGPSTAGVVTVTFAAQQTINGTLSTTGTAGNRRVFFDSATYGISVDLVVNSAPSLTDADFRGIYVRGTSAPISGTRIGNRGECRNITFSTPKTVYWNLAGAQNWSANGWATTSTGSPATANFPLPQDTATFTNAGSVTGTITLDTAIGYVPTVDMSGRTTAMTLGTSNATTVYGNWTNGSGTAFTAAATLSFQGGGSQTITSAGKTFSGSITVDTYGGTVQLADALNIGTNTLTVTNGTFDTKSYAVVAGILFSSNTNVRTIKLGASNISNTNSGGSYTLTSTNLTFDAGTSTITFTGILHGINATGLTFYNVSFTTTFATSFTVQGPNTFNNLLFTAPSSSGITTVSFSGGQTINGTLTCAGASAVRRIFVRSDTLNTQRTLTAASISAADCDFRDIALSGAASGAAPTRAGDCGGNSGITFPAAKTVYWNLAGTQNWSATGWATSSGGSPAVNNFPLAQDTAVFDNTGAAGTITIEQAWNIGTFDASLRTSAMTLTTSTNNPSIYGDWKFGTGVTSTSTTGFIRFVKNGTQTITSNGVEFGTEIIIGHINGIVQLADALFINSARQLSQTAGIFDAVTYNVTTGTVANISAASTLRMGIGTWTLTGTVTVWNFTATPTLVVGTSTIVLSNTSTAAREFRGGGLYYNKLTIGGATGTSTLTITGNNTFGELASTKTVAHTIALGTTTQTFGKWSVTGTAGNVVSVTGTGTSHVIAGPAVSGVDYLAMGSIGFSTTSPGEFYAGANSTGTAAAPVFRTAAPAARTLYWVGGTGNWSSTTKWSTSSGGASGAAIPTSLDAVNFDSLSNATAYTATIDAGVTLARCASFTMAGPAAGNVTFAGTVPIAFHGNVSFAATGITRTYTGTMNWVGNASYTFTTNGLAFASSITVIGVGSTWTLGSALDIAAGGILTVTYGAFSTSASNYSFSGSSLQSDNSNIRTITLNNSSILFQQSSSITFNNTTNLTFSSGTSAITASASAPNFNGGGQTFYNVSFTYRAGLGPTISGANIFNNLTFPGQTSLGVGTVIFSANQTINGTLTVSAGTASAYRTFLASNTIGTTRTLTCAAVSATDADFRDITIAGAAAPASGTRLGDAKGNSGITFPAAKTVYWAVNTANWGATGAGSWSATSGGAAANDQFPLAQDTAYIPFATPTSGSTITVNANYNIGTIEMSNRNGSALVTLATGSTTPAIYGNWINGTGTTISGTGRLTYAGRGAQQITGAGKTFTQQTTINSLGGSVTLQDAWVTSSGTTNLNPELLAGTFDANGYNVTNAGTGTFLAFSSTGTLTRTLAIGSGTWTFAGGGGQWTVSGSNITVTGTGTISLTSASGKTFAGGGVSYSGITLNQGGAGALTITGNNTFKTITNTYSATGATSIALGNTTQTLTDPWTATGASGNVLTLSGTSAASPGTLIYTGAGVAANSVDYLSISNVRAYPLVDEWYAGANSTNGGSLGWYFVAAGGTVYAATILETGTGSDSISAAFGGVTYLGTITELATGSDSVLAQAIFKASLAESGFGTDTISAQSALGSAILESATIADTNLARLIARATVAETATGSDSESASLTAKGTISETATGTDTDSAFLTVNSSLSDTATATDTDFATLTAQSSISETATGTDAVSARAVFLAAVAESATITDLIDAIKGYFVYILESASASDTVSPRYIANPTISESAAAAEIVEAYFIAAAQISELATGTDAVSALKVLAAAVAEAATATDAVVGRIPLFALIQEAAAAQDSVTAAGSIYRVLLQELATAQDAIAAKATFRSSLTETATGTETNRATFIPRARITETATITDVARAAARFAARILETSAASDSVRVAPSVFNAIAVAAATAIDSFNPAGSIYNASIPESAFLSDSVIGAYLWNDINDEQNANWVDVNDVLVASWTQIQNDQTPGWNQIDDGENVSWTDIDDSQNPGWQNS